LVISLRGGGAARVRTIDSIRQLRLDQASEVIAVARQCEQGLLDPGEAATSLRRTFASPPRFGTVAYVAALAVLTVGLGLLIRPAAVDLWVYAALGAMVGVMKAYARRFASNNYLLPVLAAALVSAISFLAHGSNDAASLRLTIPPLVTFLPGALLTMATVDLAMGETIAGASRFVAGMLQLALLAIGIIIGAEVVGNPHTGPVAGPSADTLGAWAPWVGVVLFAAGVYVHDSAPKRSLPWLTLVLFSAFIGQLLGERIIDATLSGFIGAAIMVPVAHAVAHIRTAPPAHVMFLPAFWMLVPGTLGLIGITELVGKDPEHGFANLIAALAAIPAIALGVLFGTMIVRAARFVRITRFV
jgi:uncharacterized membrane protein YjjP (DUF1212 family)